MPRRPQHSAGPRAANTRSILDELFAHPPVSRAELEQRTKELLANPSARSEALNQAMSAVAKHADFARRLTDAVRRGNEKLAHVESVRRFFVLERDFSQEHGELTPTLKVKRKEVLGRYADTFSRLYDDETFGYSA